MAEKTTKKTKKEKQRAEVSARLRAEEKLEIKNRFMEHLVKEKLGLSEADIQRVILCLTIALEIEKELSTVMRGKSG